MELTRRNKTFLYFILNPHSNLHIFNNGGKVLPSLLLIRFTDLQFGKEKQGNDLISQGFTSTQIQQMTRVDSKRAADSKSKALIRGKP